MKPDRLGKILTEMETRITRAQNEGRGGDLDVLKAAVRRCRTKLDKLNPANVAELKALVGKITSSTNPLGLSNLISGLEIGLNQLSPDDLLEATPGQKLAAFQFGFDGDALTVIDQPIMPYENERNIAMASLEAAIQNGVHVNDDLLATNISPKVKEAFSRLQATMLSHSNIVQVGANAQICSRYVQLEVEEFSSSVAAMLIGHLESVFAALSQFKDWREYCENAYSLHLEPGAIKQLTVSAEFLLQRLRETPAVDPAVPAALETVVGWVEDHPQPDKRDVLSLGRTLENVWSVVFKQLLSASKETLSETRKLAIKGVAATLLLAAASMVPIIGKIPGAQWIETAWTYVKNYGEGL